MDTIIEVATTAADNSGGASAPSAVSWPAIVAGAVVAAASSLILLALGTGLGLASISPWANLGATISSFTLMSAIWLILTQWIASGVGGYLTGRLRTRWLNTHAHEVFFRDTAHGFLMWALATLIAAALFGWAAVMASGTAAHLPSAESPAPPTLAYDVDGLFRSPSLNVAPNNSQARTEAARILVMAAVNGILPVDDHAYMARLIVAQTGVSPAEAEQRVAAVVAREQASMTFAKQTADNARKAGAALAMFTALSMLIGALIACISAALGGQQRDEHIWSARGR
jgi:hypothetical protein